MIAHAIGPLFEFELAFDFPRLARIHFNAPNVQPITYNTVKEVRRPPMIAPNFQLAIAKIVVVPSLVELKKSLDLVMTLSMLAGETLTSAS